MYAWINRIKKLKVSGKKRTSGPKVGEEDAGGGGDVNGVAVAAAAATCAQNPTCRGGYGERGGEVEEICLARRGLLSAFCPPTIIQGDQAAWTKNLLLTLM